MGKIVEPLASPSQWNRWKFILTNHYGSEELTRQIFRREVVVNERTRQAEHLNAEAKMKADLLKSVSDRYTFRSFLVSLVKKGLVGEKP